MNIEEKIKELENELEREKNHRFSLWPFLWKDQETKNKMAMIIYQIDFLAGMNPKIPEIRSRFECYVVFVCMTISVIFGILNLANLIWNHFH